MCKFTRNTALRVRCIHSSAGRCQFLYNFYVRGSSCARITAERLRAARKASVVQSCRRNSQTEEVQSCEEACESLRELHELEGARED